ncbi:MAG: SH3 domain-containing protein [Phreatobacter sp.]|uniref:SH3 domain-containing protein n=1 Tax=Phreatobacter sp. TaxID=1966341 RepID=UPI00273721B8|nr:SH3 domain-containing protein [Phreatobacter sp.]MDP2800467.1 SH3 domain-containing protein [Phreatobacter sp.]
MFRTAAFAAALAFACLSSGAEAQSARCRVMDPTGTPLNIRDAPNGDVVGRVRNGALVTRLRVSEDDRGRPWAYVADRASGEPLGWVYREFIACF